MKDTQKNAYTYTVEIKDSEYNVLETKVFSEYESAQRFLQKLEASTEVRRGFRLFDFYRSDVA